MLIGYESAFDATQAAAETNQETIRRREFPSERHWFTPGWAQIYDGWVQSPRAGDVIQPEESVRRREFPWALPWFTHRRTMDQILGWQRGPMMAAAFQVCDDFTGSDGALGANWVGAGGTGSGCERSSNQARASATGTLNINCRASGTFANDQFAEVIVVNIEAITNDGVGAGPLVRGSDAGSFTGYWVLFSGNWLTLQKRVGGTNTTLLDQAATVTPGDLMRLEAEGTALRVYINGGLQASTTDSDLASGRPGIAARVNAPEVLNDTLMDDW